MSIFEKTYHLANFIATYNFYDYIINLGINWVEAIGVSYDPQWEGRNAFYMVISDLDKQMSNDYCWLLECLSNSDKFLQDYFQFLMKDDLISVFTSSKNLTIMRDVMHPDMWHGGFEALNWRHYISFRLNCTANNPHPTELFDYNLDSDLFAEKYAAIHKAFYEYFIQDHLYWTQDRYISYQPFVAMEHNYRVHEGVYWAVELSQVPQNQTIVLWMRFYYDSQQFLENFEAFYMTASMYWCCWWPTLTFYYNYCPSLIGEYFFIYEKTHDFFWASAQPYHHKHYWEEVQTNFYWPFGYKEL